MAQRFVHEVGARASVLLIGGVVGLVVADRLAVEVVAIALVCSPILMLIDPRPRTIRRLELEDGTARATRSVVVAVLPVLALCVLVAVLANVGFEQLPTLLLGFAAVEARAAATAWAVERRTGGAVLREPAAAGRAHLTLLATSSAARGGLTPPRAG